jgi:hypothetical protein
MRGKVDRAKIADKATPEARLAKLENKNVIPASVEPVTTVTTIQPSFPPALKSRAPMSLSGSKGQSSDNFRD